MQYRIQTNSIRCSNKSEANVWIRVAAANKDLLEDLDVFQRKGLRQILKIPTTHGQNVQGHPRTWTNDRIYELVNAKINTCDARRITDTHKSSKVKRYMDERIIRNAKNGMHIQNIKRRHRRSNKNNNTPNKHDHPTRLRNQMIRKA